MDLLSRFRQSSTQADTPGKSESGQAKAQRTHTAPWSLLVRDRETALDLARERYRRQNDTGFGYQAGKKDFDTLVKEAEQEVLGLKVKQTRRRAKWRHISW